MRMRPLLLCSFLLAGSPAAAETYTDVTAAAGIAGPQHVWNLPPDCLIAGVFCEPERMSGGAAVGDVDGDGWDDLLVTRLEAPDVLFRNLGDGTFSDVTAGSGLDLHSRNTNGALFLDVDKDGDLDLYVTTLAEDAHLLFINDGTGTFSEEAAVRGADVFSSGTRIGYGLAAGDFDKDGWPDLYVGEWRPSGLAAPGTSNSRLLRNRGAAAPGHFEDVTLAAGVQPAVVIPNESWVFAPAFVDLDGDSWPDLTLTSDFGTTLLFWNDGDGTFTEDTAGAGVGTDENGMGSTFGDYDGDGDLDWFVTSIFDPAETCETVSCGWGYSGNRLFRNEGGRSFTDQTDSAGVREGYWGWGAAFFDSDNDGDLDLVQTNGVDFPDGTGGVPVGIDADWEMDPMRFWRNDGTGVMSEVSAAVGLTDTGSGKGLLVFDYDRDGDQDVLIANNQTGPLLYRNDGGNANEWLRVRVVGRGDTTSGFGTRIQISVTGPSDEQVRILGATSHFLGQSERTAHFGLGAATQVATLEVKFPNGAKRILKNVPSGQEIVIDQAELGCGLLGVEAWPALACWLARRRRRPALR